MNRDNFSQQLSLFDGRIFLLHAVAARNEKCFFAGGALARDAMNKKTSATSVEHEIARLNFLNTMSSNGETIARPQGGQHADSAGAESQLPCGLQYLGPQNVFARFAE